MRLAGSVGGTGLLNRQRPLARTCFDCTPLVTDVRGSNDVSLVLNTIAGDLGYRFRAGAGAAALALHQGR